MKYGIEFIFHVFHLIVTKTNVENVHQGLYNFNTSQQNKVNIYNLRLHIFK